MDPVGEFYRKPAEESEASGKGRRPQPATVYEKGQHLLELRQRALSPWQTVAVVVITALITVIVAYAAMAILK